MNAQLLFCYAVDYKKPPGRKTIRGSFVSSGTVVIGTAERFATSSAFDVESRTKSGVRRSLSIRSWGGSIWWPWPREYGDDATLKAIKTPEKLLRALETGSADPFCLRDLDEANWQWPSGPKKVFDHVNCQNVIKSNAAESLENAKRQAENFLLCGGCIFIKGGDPVYVVVGGLKSRQKPVRIKVVDSSLFSVPLAHQSSRRLHIKQPWNDEIFEAVTAGQVFRADQRTEALACAAGIDQSFNSGDCPEITARVPIAAHLNQLQIDAAFWNICSRLAAREGSGEFPEIYAVALNAVATWSDREQALLMFLYKRHAGAMRVDEKRLAHMAITRRNHFLADADIEALDSLPKYFG